MGLGVRVIASRNVLFIALLMERIVGTHKKEGRKEKIEERFYLGFFFVSLLIKVEILLKMGWGWGGSWVSLQKSHTISC